MVCIPKDNASSVGPVTSGAAVRHQLLHAYSSQKPWTFDAGVAARVHELDVRANAWLLW